MKVYYFDKARTQATPMSVPSRYSLDCSSFLDTFLVIHLMAAELRSCEVAAMNKKY